MRERLSKAYKYRLNPTNQQRVKIAQFAGCARYAYNYALAQIKNALDKKEKIPNYIDAANLLPFLKIAKETEFLADAPAQVLQQALKDLYLSMADWFRKLKPGKKRRVPRYRLRGKNDTFKYPQHIKCEGSKIWLPKIGWVKYRNSRPIPGVIKQAVIYKKGKHWYVTIFFVEEVDITPVAIVDEEAIGLDVGISCYVATSDGNKVDNPKYLHALLRKLRYLYRALSRKKKFSSNWKKCVAKIQQLHSRISNLRNDFLHKLSTEIAKNHGVVSVEDLNIKGMMKNKKLSRAIADAGWGKFLLFLQYKCAWTGKHFVKIDRWFASSQLCSSCGNKQAMPLHKRVYDCEICDLVEDRDINASVNIRSAGLSALKVCGEIANRQLSEAGIAGF